MKLCNTLTMKKVISIFLSVLILSTLIACKNENAIVPDEKIKLSLGIMFTTDFIGRIVNDFNELNLNYEIEIKDYFAENGNASITMYNLDLISGNAPDIMLISQDTFMPLRSYFDKGVFIDLYELIDADADINREDFVESIIKAHETNGKLYSISDSVVIQTLTGKTSLVGADMGQTWDEFFAFLDEHPEALPFSPKTSIFSKENFVVQMVLNSLSTFIDEDKNECYFEADEFLKLLEYAWRFPEERRDDNVDVSGFYTEDKLLLLNHFSGFNYLNITGIDVLFKEEITYKGFPVNDGSNGALFLPNARFAITSQTQNIEGAWEFVKFILTDFQNSGWIEKSDFGSDFSVRKDKINRAVVAALGDKDRIFESHGDDYKHEIYIEGIPGFVEAVFPTEEDVQKIIDLVDSTTKIWRQDYYIIWMTIYEELPAYFNGQKTAEDVARIIQSKASIYLAELN
ncbi:MAG: extracellular solute-binding protein [Oscillospiraceae bacterium]|nr:extracellular solute-binding protein [Oscillospiraceae bacterium]